MKFRYVNCVFEDLFQVGLAIEMYLATCCHVPMPRVSLGKLPCLCICNKKWFEQVLTQMQFLLKMSTKIALRCLISININQLRFSSHLSVSVFIQGKKIFRQTQTQINRPVPKDNCIKTAFVPMPVFAHAGK